MRHPFTRYRKNRTSDGEGGFTESATNAELIYGVVRIYEAETYVVIDSQEDVKTEDILRFEDYTEASEWIVTKLDKLPGRREMRAYIEKTERPITP